MTLTCVFLTNLQASKMYEHVRVRTYIEFHKVRFTGIRLKHTKGLENKYKF